MEGYLMGTQKRHFLSFCKKTVLALMGTCAVHKPRQSSIFIFLILVVSVNIKLHELSVV